LTAKEEKELLKFERLQQNIDCEQEQQGLEFENIDSDIGLST
jgi:hypothetical protein